MKQTISKQTLRTGGLLAAALLLFIAAWLLPLPSALQILLCSLSFAVSLLELLGPLSEDLRRKRFFSRQLLLVLSGLLGLCFGLPLAAALMLLLFRVASLLLSWQERRLAVLIAHRRDLSPHAKMLGDYIPSPVVAGRIPLLVKNWLPQVLLMFAALVAVLTALLSKGGAVEGVRHAAVLLALSGGSVLFAANGLCDFASVVGAAEHGVVCSSAAVGRLLDAGLLYEKPNGAVQKGEAQVIPVEPEQVSSDALLLLASHAYSYSRLPVSASLSKLYGKPLDRSSVEDWQVLPGYGVAAKLRGMPVLSGSAAYLAKSGLPLAPFSDPRTICLGVNGRYAGCICLDAVIPSEESLEKDLSESGLYLFHDESELQKKRQHGETLIYASDDGTRGCSLPEDVYVSLGGYGACDIAVDTHGQAGLQKLLHFRSKASLIRFGCFLLIAAAKAVCILLACFGLCPLWLPVTLESAAVLGSFFYSLRAMDHDPTASLS